MDKDERQMDYILSNIPKARQQGITSFYLRGNFNDTLIERLKGLGYDVVKYDSNNLLIKWTL